MGHFATKSQTADAKASLALMRAFAAKLHELGILGMDDLNDISRWAAEDIGNNNSITDNEARDLVSLSFMFPQETP